MYYDREIFLSMPYFCFCPSQISVFFQVLNMYNIFWRICKIYPLKNIRRYKKQTNKEEKKVLLEKNMK